MHRRVHFWYDAFNKDTLFKRAVREHAMTAVMALPAINLSVKICTLFKEEEKVLPAERGKMNNRICSPVPRRECLKICYGNRRYRCGGLHPRDIF